MKGRWTAHLESVVITLVIFFLSCKRQPSQKSDVTSMSTFALQASRREMPMPKSPGSLSSSDSSALPPAIHPHFSSHPTGNSVRVCNGPCDVQHRGNGFQRPVETAVNLRQVSNLLRVAAHPSSLLASGYTNDRVDRTGTSIKHRGNTERWLVAHTDVCFVASSRDGKGVSS